MELMCLNICVYMCKLLPKEKATIFFVGNLGVQGVIAPYFIFKISPLGLLELVFWHLGEGGGGGGGKDCVSNV